MGALAARRLQLANCRATTSLALWGSLLHTHGQASYTSHFIMAFALWRRPWKQCNNLGPQSVCLIRLLNIPSSDLHPPFPFPTSAEDDTGPTLSERALHSLVRVLILPNNHVMPSPACKWIVKSRPQKQVP